MHLTRLITILLCLSGLTFTAPSFAVMNFGTYQATMWNTPAQFFTDEDWTIFNATLEDVLNNAKDNDVPKTWSNPKTKAHGEFSILKTVEKHDTICREVKTANSAGTARRVWGVAFCKQEDGSWKAVSGR